MLEAAKHGVILMRNNQGAGQFIDEATGHTSYVRFGLMNISKEQNKKIKSSDLIGISPHRYGDGFSGGIVGIFIAVEVKKEGWTYKGDAREKAQLAFIDFVKARGGIAGFCASVNDFLKLIGKA